MEHILWLQAGFQTSVLLSGANASLKRILDLPQDILEILSSTSMTMAFSKILPHLAGSAALITLE